MRLVFQVNFRSEIKKRNSVVPEQLSFYPFIQGMMDIKADPFNLKSWLGPFKRGFELGERGIDDLSITHARHRKGLDPAFAQQKRSGKIKLI